MPTLELTLTPEAVGRFHDVLIGLSKFNESVCIEARRDKLLFTALNSTKSAYACFSFDSQRFFSRYDFVPDARQARDGDGGARFCCSIYNKALLSVFKGRLFDSRDKVSSVERCEISILDRPQKAECRLVVKMICRHGVLKTYRLTYESVESMHALFDREAAQNRWSISSKILREFVEHFGPRTEQLDIYSESGRATFTSYTEKIVHQNEVLKQPLQTSVAIDNTQFESFAVEEKLHVAVSVKDFKAIVAHAETLNASISAAYSIPNRPMQLAYHANGVSCEFTLMTIGEYHGASVAPAPMAAQVKEPQPAALASKATTPDDRGPRPSPATMPPPGRPAQKLAQEGLVRRESRPSPPPPQPSIDSQSLFIPHDDDDRRWDEPNSDDDEEEEMLTWDASADNDTLNGLSRSVQDAASNKRSRPDGDDDEAAKQRIAPTQRLSQVHGLFDD